MSLDSCPPEKIRNPKTKRCVLKTGKIGKSIINKKRSSQSYKSTSTISPIIKDCPPEKILNPMTKRCVLKTGKIGKSLIDEDNNNNINIKNINNSCYLDSLLVGLFHFKNKEIYDIFFNSKMNDYGNKELNKLGILIKKELLNIYVFILNKKENEEIKYCSQFRKLLQKYYNIYSDIFPKEKILFNSRDNWTHKQLDIFELLNFLSIIFDFKSKRMTKIIEGTNKYYSNFIIEIPVYELLNKKRMDISEIYPLKRERYELDENNKYINSKGEIVSYYNKEKEYIKTSSFIYFQIYRNMGSEEKIKTSIKYPMEIRIKENSKKLKIKSLIIHIGESVNSGHYITIINRKGRWYKYNDMEERMREIREVERYSKNIVGLLYSF